MLNHVLCVVLCRVVLIVFDLYTALKSTWLFLKEQSVS